MHKLQLSVILTVILLCYVRERYNLLWGPHLHVKNSHYSNEDALAKRHETQIMQICISLTAPTLKT